jgi:hypothetical protein
MSSRCPAKFNLQRDVQLPRQKFITRFLAHVTRKKADRDYSGGLRVRCSRGAWVIDWPELGKGRVMSTSKTEEGLYDTARRGTLNYYVRQAEDLWEEGHQALGGSRRGRR